LEGIGRIPQLGTQLEMGGNDQRITLGNAGNLHDAHLERRRR
jgi:hypothetical protein